MNNYSRRLTTIVLSLALPLLFGGARAAEAQSLTASFTYPTDGAVAVDMSTSVQWTTVAGAQAYYLYLGTSLGASNLVNSGELQVTSYRAINIPSGVTIYARLWTKLSGVWRSTDIAFTAAPDSVLEFTFPPSGALTADLRSSFEWTSIPNAQAYYLYVGTALGQHNLADSGELQIRTYLAYNLPLNQPLYLRLWVKVAGLWRYVDRTVTATNTAPQYAQFTYPLNGATNVNLDQPFTWSTAINADAYYLYVGTTVGAKDVVNSGELTGTSYLSPNLPTGQTLYGRIWTATTTTWRYVDITFVAVPGALPTFVYPTNGTTMDISLPFSWTSVPNADAYQLTVGTTPGGSNVMNTGETQATSVSASTLPTTGTFYARVSARVAGVWRYSEIAFSTTPLTASLITPVNGSTTFDPAQNSFQWTSVPVAQKYYLWVGTTPGSNNLINSQELCNLANCLGGALATSWNPLDGGKSGAPGLGQVWHATTLYARLWTMAGDGNWRYVDSTFTTSQLVPFITNPLDGSVQNSTHTTVTWNAVAGATKYRVTVDVLCDATHTCSKQQADYFLDSGLLDSSVLSYVAVGTPARSTLICRVYALVGGVWRYEEVTYTHQKDL